MSAVRVRLAAHTFMKYALRIFLPILALVIFADIFYSVTAAKKQTPTVAIQKNKIMKQMTLTSPEFGEKEKIPSKYTCDGEDVNPPLEFNNVSEDAQSLTLIVEDPDAPGKTWVHWVVFNISPRTTAVSEDSVPGRGTEAVTDFGEMGYGGPCPPAGTHRYNFKLYALDTMLDLTEDVTRAEIEHSMEGHILEKAELTGLYSRE